MYPIQYNFYGRQIHTPLSLAHKTSRWHRSLIGRMHAMSQGSIYILELDGRDLQAGFAWRVVDVKLSQEDTTMSYFKAYGLDGDFLPDAAFGVNYGSVPQRIKNDFIYPLRFGNQYYVPEQNCMNTPNTGGYSVQVLDYDYPSESLAFGLYKQGEQHQGLVISFRLFELHSGYPNDMPGVEIR